MDQPDCPPVSTEEIEKTTREENLPIISWCQGEQSPFATRVTWMHLSNGNNQGVSTVRCSVCENWKQQLKTEPTEKQPELTDAKANQDSENVFRALPARPLLAHKEHFHCVRNYALDIGSPTRRLVMEAFVPCSDIVENVYSDDVAVCYSWECYACKEWDSHFEGKSPPEPEEITLAKNHENLTAAFNELNVDIRSVGKLWVGRVKRLHKRVQHLIRIAEREITHLANNGRFCEASYNENLQQLNDLVKVIRELSEKLNREKIESEETSGSD